MRRNAVAYWDKMGKARDVETRDAILSGFRSERAFDEAGKEDASHLILPFITPRERVLDVGCGIGRLLKWVAPHCLRIYGLDVSRAMLAKARRRCRSLRNVSLRRLATSLRFPIGDRTIDFAYLYHVSEHMEREDLLTILREVRRVLRPKGRALVQFSLLEHADNQREFRKWAAEGDPEGVRSRFYTEAEAALMLELARLYPQIRLFIPGEYAVVAVRSDDRPLGAMPLVKLRSAGTPR